MVDAPSAQYATQCRTSTNVTYTLENASGSFSETSAILERAKCPAKWKETLVAREKQAFEVAWVHISSFSTTLNTTTLCNQDSAVTSDTPTSVHNTNDWQKIWKPTRLKMVRPNKKKHESFVYIAMLHNIPQARTTKHEKQQRKRTSARINNHRWLLNGKPSLTWRCEIRTHWTLARRPLLRLLLGIYSVVLHASDRKRKNTLNETMYFLHIEHENIALQGCSAHNWMVLRHFCRKPTGCAKTSKILF